MNKENNIDLIILAGGMGTRVESITKDKIQKVMLPVNDTPFLTYVVKLYVKKGYKRIIIASGHKSESIKKYFGDGKSYEADISYSEEKIPLGTGGGLRLALSYAKTKNVLVINGDTIFDIDLEKLREEHLKSQAIATLALKNNKDSARYGVVELNNDNNIINFKEKVQSTGLISGGIYFINKEKIEKIIDNIFEERPLSLEKNIWPYLVIQKSINGLNLDGTFIDMGTPESYLEASKILKKYE